jgi:hypothetical protein
VRALRCKTCGEPILLVPRPGFIIRGQPKSFAVNPDDRLPHARRCKLTVELRTLRSPRPHLRKLQNTGSLAKPEAPGPTSQKELFT